MTVEPKGSAVYKQSLCGEESIFDFFSVFHKNVIFQSYTHKEIWLQFGLIFVKFRGSI